MLRLSIALALTGPIVFEIIHAQPGQEASTLTGSSGEIDAFGRVPEAKRQGMLETMAANKRSFATMDQLVKRLRGRDAPDNVVILDGLDSFSDMDRVHAVLNEVIDRFGRRAMYIVSGEGVLADLLYDNLQERRKAGSWHLDSPTIVRVISRVQMLSWALRGERFAPKADELLLFSHDRESAGQYGNDRLNGSDHRVFTADGVDPVALLAVEASRGRPTHTAYVMLEGHAETTRRLADIAAMQGVNENSRSRGRVMLMPFTGFKLDVETHSYNVAATLADEMRSVLEIVSNGSITYVTETHPDADTRLNSPEQYVDQKAHRAATGRAAKPSIVNTADPEFHWQSHSDAVLASAELFWGSIFRTVDMYLRNSEGKTPQLQDWAFRKELLGVASTRDALAVHEFLCSRLGEAWADSDVNFGRATALHAALRMRDAAERIDRESYDMLMSKPIETICTPLKKKSAYGRL